MNVNDNFTCLVTTFIVTSCRLTFRAFSAHLVVQDSESFRRSFQFYATSDRRAIKNTTFRELKRIRMVPMFNDFVLFTFRCFNSSLHLSSRLIARYITNVFIFIRLFNSSIANAFWNVICIFRIAFSRKKNTSNGVVLPLWRRSYNGQFRSFLTNNFHANFPFKFMKRVSVFRFHEIPNIISTLLRLNNRFALFNSDARGHFLTFNCVTRLVISLLSLLCLGFVRSAHDFFAMATSR